MDAKISVFRGAPPESYRCRLATSNPWQVKVTIAGIFANLCDLLYDSTFPGLLSRCSCCDDIDIWIKGEYVWSKGR